MTLRVSGKNLDIGESLRGQVETRVSGAVQKYFDGGFNGQVVVEREGTGFRTHCAIHLDSGITLQSSATAHNAYASSDIAAERIEKRLRRYKRRIRDRHAGEDGAPLDMPYSVLEVPEDDGEVEAVNPVVVAESMRSLRLMAVRDAVMELDMTGAPVVVFRHAASGRVNVVYRRIDGHVGWVDPPVGPGQPS
jgi:ribosomal subunit interface protein